MTGVDRRPIGYVPVFAFVAFAWRSIRSHRFQSITAARAAVEILDTMADALFVIDAEARVRVTNEAVRKLFGYAESEILGKTIDTLEYVDPEASFSRALGDMLRRAPIRDEERVFRTRNGERIDVSISVSSLHEREMEGGAVVIVRDIRERKRVEQEMRDFTIQLQQSNRELEDFAYVASHDLQEPLRKIQAFGDRLKVKYAETLVGDGIDYLDRMQKAAGRMQALINDLLVFSRITTKAQPFAAVDLEEIAHEVVHDLEVRIHQANGEVIVGALPAIDADALQMRQLLQNLVGNGLKFHRPDLPPRVEISGKVFNNTAEITVSDNGIGFDEKYADRIFTMFERLHGRAAYEGTGIGLAICRKIAHRHGGEIRANSVPGAGARFVVTLPVMHKVDRRSVD
jgi:PAS domain S-box-containing protein